MNSKLLLRKLFGSQRGWKNPTALKINKKNALRFRRLIMRAAKSLKRFHKKGGMKMPRESESTATVEEMMYTSEFEGLSQYRVPYSRELEGTCLNILFDDSSKLMVSFPSRDTILFSENAGDFVMETCHTMKAEDTVYLIFVDRRNEHPRSGMILVIDMDNHLVTGTFMKQGLTSSYPGLVSREIKFGVIKDGDHPLPEARHSYTDDLVGKKIEWSYNPDFEIMHVYLSPSTYCWAMNSEMQKKMQDARIQQGLPLDDMKPIVEPCAYIKIRRNLYVFTFVEENQGSGTQAFFVINTDRLIDCGVFFGNNPQGNPEGYMVSAYGKWINERIAYEDILNI